MTVLLCDEVDNSIEESLAVIFDTVGVWSSLLLIFTVMLSVDVFPVVSATVSVRVSVDEPKL